MKLRPIMNDHAGRKFAWGREMENNEFSWSGLIQLGVAKGGPGKA